MGREGVVVDGRYTIKGKETKNVLDDLWQLIDPIWF
jgi:hypothetical protein